LQTVFHFFALYAVIAVYAVYSVYNIQHYIALSSIRVTKNG
jgi:presenilin-like A22 family membrane protease